MEAVPRPRLSDGPIVVAVARNEMLRLPDYLRHHRGIGVRHFLIVDNDSTDDSAEYLDAQPDVTRFFSARPFLPFKPIFRPWLADNYGHGRWVLAPDLDEHFVYPGWPHLTLEPLLRHWERQGHEAVFAPMVDMYADRPLAEIEHGPEARLVEVYRHFDAKGYWIAPPKPSRRTTSPTPPALLYGGSRARFRRLVHGISPTDRLAAALGWSFMNHRNPRHPRPGAWMLHRHFMQRTVKTGTSSKVPLVRWRRGLRYPGSNHRINAQLDLAPDWGALLHFRLMIDYVDRESAWDARKLRTEDRQQRIHQSLAGANLMWEGSGTFTGWRDFERAGLMRASTNLRGALGLENAPDRL